MGIAYEAFQPQVACLNAISAGIISSAFAAEPVTASAVGASVIGVLAALCGALIYFSIWLISHTFCDTFCPFASIDAFLKTTQQILRPLF